MIQNRGPVRDEITHRAYAPYLMRGCGHGGDIEDWVKATKELTDELNVSVVTDDSREAVSNRADLRYAWPE
jgi:hypothetical protein